MAIKHDPVNGQYGDCHRCSIAYMMGFRWQDVPHFYDGGKSGEEAWAHVQFWLRQFGLTQVSVLFNGEATPQEVIDSVSINNPDVMFILGAESRSGVGHSMVCKNNKIVYDSHGSGAVGPMESGYYVVTFLASIRTVRKD